MTKGSVRRVAPGHFILCTSSSDDLGMPENRAYRFTITFEVEADHPAFDDPEWAADAAWGALSNVYDLRAIYTDIEEIDPHRPL